MAITGKTKHPAEVKEAFRLFADILHMYADDQTASLRWNKGKQGEFCKVRAEVYNSIAAEMKEIVWEHE